MLFWNQKVLLSLTGLGRNQGKPNHWLCSRNMPLKEKNICNENTLLFYILIIYRCILHNLGFETSQAMSFSTLFCFLSPTGEQTVDALTPSSSIVVTRSYYNKKRTFFLNIKKSETLETDNTKMGYYNGSNSVNQLKVWMKMASEF